MIAYIDAANFSALMTQHKDLKILDIRTDIERAALSLQYPTTHIALHDIEIERINTIHHNDSPLYVLCKAGPRAQKIAEYLQTHGITNLTVINGGILGCADHGSPLIHGDDPVTPDTIMHAIQESVQKFMMKNV